jgi:hypothetical protein
MRSVLRLRAENTNGRVRRVLRACVISVPQDPGPDTPAELDWHENEPASDSPFN